MHAAEFPLLSIGQFGLLTAQLPSGAGDGHALAGEKEGAQRRNYAGQRGYHPLLAIAAETGEVLMCRLRKGRANTARGAAHFLRETVSRVRYAGATGPLTMRADSGFYNHDIVAVGRQLGVRFSITTRQRQSVHNIIAAIPEADWTPIPYWMEGPPMWRRLNTLPSGANSTPCRCGSSSGALLDRLTHHVHILEMNGDSYRLRGSRREAAAGVASPDRSAAG